MSMLLMRPRPILLLLPLLVAGRAGAQSIDLDFSSLGTAAIFFNGPGKAFTFTPDATTGYDFQVGTSNLSGLIGDKGVITGNFQIGTLTPFGMGLFQGEEASVTGSGKLTISDGSASLFTAAITWDTVAMLGTSGMLNSIGAPNLTNFTYDGTNPYLKELADDSSGTVAASFQFISTESLSGQIGATNSINPSTFSGSFEAIPEPRAYAALLGGAVLIGAVALRRFRPARV